MELEIDIYPGNHALEGVPAEFSTEEWPADPSIGDLGGVWATLEHITLGGLILPREQVLLMVGCKAVVKIETDASETLSRNDPACHPMAAE